MKNFRHAVVVATAIIGHASSAQAQTAPFVADVSGALSLSSAVGLGWNEVQTYQIGASAHITAVTYDVTITAFEPSTLHEAMLEIAGSDPENGGTVIIPRRSIFESGTQTFRGSVDFVSRGYDFWTGDDGMLRLEFFEGYEDLIGGVGGLPNAIWRSGTLSFQYTPAATLPVPEPATWTMMLPGCCATGMATRSRRRKSALA